MTRWLLNTLSYRLRSELRVWRKASQTLRKNAWPLYQRVLVSAGEHPLWFPLRLFLVVLLLSAAAWGYKVYYPPATYISPSPLSGLEDYFFTLWTVQATIAAMIYPIVIGFVALLLQRRHSAKASLQIYLHDSAAILTGLSALFLVMTMAVQYFFISTIGNKVLTCWLTFDGIWFLFNIVGVIWFLVRTFDYLRPELRANIQRAYAINHVWPAEIQRHLEYHLFLNAIGYGWLPGPSYLDAENNSNATVQVNPIGMNKGQVQVTEHKKDEWFIHDVRFRLLSWAVLSWQRREDKSDVSAHTRHSRSLVFPQFPGTQFRVKYGLCRTEGGTGLRWWERWLVRRSFVLSPNEKKMASLSIDDILSELITKAQIDMEGSEEAAFREALGELVDMHAALIQGGNCVTDTGQRDNYATLSNRDHVLGFAMHLLWAREYHRLLETAVDRLPMSDTYFNQMVDVPGRLIEKLKDVRPIAIPSHFIRLSRSMHYRLNRWWSRSVEEQGILKHGPCDPTTLRAPTFALYDDAIKAYIGAWESLKNNQFTPAHNEVLTWEQYGEISEFYTIHLDSTLYMLFDSLTLGNEVGAEWLCDSLIKWWAMIHFRLDHTGYFIRDKSKLTLELTQSSWQEAKKAIDFTMPALDEVGAPEALWSACIYNYWVDLCCVSLYTMIQLGKACKGERSLPANLAGYLVKGEALRAGGVTVSTYWPNQSLEDLLIAIIRQFYFDGGYHRGYRARLDRVVEGIFEQKKPAMVPGRSYFESGANDLDTLTDGQLISLCLLIEEGWRPSARFVETIRIWGGRDDASQRAFTIKLEQWQSRLNDANFRDYKHLFSCIQKKIGAVENFDAATAALKSGLGQLIDVIEDFRGEQLRDAKISEERLKDVARWSSVSGFNKDSGDVPVSLFQQVLPSEEEYTEHSLIIRDVNKGEFVEPPMEQRAINEQEWFDRTIRSYVAGLVMAKTLKNLRPESVDVDGPLAYWGQIKYGASIIRKTGGTPILLVAGPAEPRWLSDWEISNYDEDVERPEDLKFVQDSQLESAGYVGSLNDIPVYVAPIGVGSSYLISQESLHTLEFTELEDGIFVEAFATPTQGKDMLINLKLVWRFQLDLSQSMCWQLRYIKSSEA